MTAATRPLRALALALALLALPAASAALPGLTVLGATIGPGDWPFYGHDHENTRANAADAAITKATAATLVPLWSADVGGDVTGTPAVAYGRVYAGTFGGSVVALDAASGSELWRYEAGFDVSASVAVDAGRVFFPDHGGSVTALDAFTGAHLWTTDLSRGQEPVALYGSPVPVRGDIVLGVSSLEELNAEEDIDFQGAVVRLDGATGALEWRTFTVCDTCQGGAVWSTPAISEAMNLLYVGVGNAYTFPAGNHTDAIVAFDLDTGAIAWSNQKLKDDVWTAPTGGPGPDFDFGASANLFELNGRLVVGEGQKSGQYHVVDAETGASVWTAKLAQGAAVGGFLGSTAVWEGRVFAGLFNVGNGQLQEPDNPDAAPTGGKVFAFSQTDGAVAWSYPNAPTWGAMGVAGDVVFHGDLTGTFWARDADTGLPLWAFPTGEPIHSGPAIANGVVYVGSGSAVGAPTGHHVWAFAPATLPVG